MFDMSNDSHLFRTRQQLESEGFELWGNRMRKGDELYLPLYEAKMIWHYDHRFGTYAGVDSRTSTQTPTPTLEQYQDPNYLIIPWYWVNTPHVDSLSDKKWHIGFRDISNNTNERTMIVSIVPESAISNKLPIISFSSLSNVFLFHANLSTIIFDYFTRQKIGGTSLNFYLVNQFPILSPKHYSTNVQTDILLRIIELTYVAWDIKPYIDTLWIFSDDQVKKRIILKWQENKEETGGHLWLPPFWAHQSQDPTVRDYPGCPLPPFKWDEDRRAVLKAELDAIYAKLYGLTTDELRYILDPQDVYGPDFPGETLRVLKEKEIRLYGEYRTKRLVMEAWEKLNN